MQESRISSRFSAASECTVLVRSFYRLLVKSDIPVRFWTVKRAFDILVNDELVYHDFSVYLIGRTFAMLEVEFVSPSSVLAIALTRKTVPFKSPFSSFETR